MGKQPFSMPQKIIMSKLQGYFSYIIASFSSFQQLILGGCDVNVCDKKNIYPLSIVHDDYKDLIMDALKTRQETENAETYAEAVKVFSIRFQIFHTNTFKIEIQHQAYECDRFS